MRSPAALIVAAVATLVVLQPQSASAAWSANATGAAPAAATSVNRAAAPTATQVGSTVRLDWAAVTLGQGTPATGYTVVRHSGATTTQVCTTTAPTRTCTDAAPVQGAVQYGVVAKYRSWTGQESPLTSFSLDVAPPLTTVTSNPAPNAAGWNKTAVTLTLTAADSAGVASITYRVGAGSPVTVTGSSTSFAVSAQGSTTISYSATDAYGNVETTRSYTVKIDTSAPSAPTISTISNDTGTAGDRVTNAPAQTLSGTAEAGATVTVSRGATTFPSVVAAANGSYSVPVTLVEGANSFTAVAADQANNNSAPSAPMVVTLDTVLSSPTITSISNDSGTAGDRVTNVAAQTLTGTADPGSTVTISRGATTFPSVVAAANGTYSVSVTLVQGANSFTAVGSDSAGNSSTSASFSVTLDTVSPTLTITDPTNGLTYGSGQAANRWNDTCAGTPGVCGTASDAGSGVTSVTLVLRDTAANTCLTSSSSFAACGSALSLTGSTTWSRAITYGVLKGRSLQLTIVVTDLAGNATTGTVSFAVQ